MRTRGVARIIAAQLVARFPSGMLSLGLLFHVERSTHSFGAAGVALAALSIGQALAGPATGRLMGRVGMRPVIIVTAIACAAGVAVIALVPMPLAGVVALAFLAGLAFPPITSAVRTIYPKLVNARMLTPLYSLDASLQELIWIGGPVAVTFVATTLSTALGLLLSVALLLGGGAWFAASPEVGRVRIPRSKRRFGAVLARPPVLLSTVVGFLMIAACADVEASVPGAFGTTNPLSGVVLAIWSLASLVGGFALGRLPMRRWSLTLRLLIVTAGSALLPFVSGFAGISGALVVAGFGIAPALGVMSAIVSSSVRFSDTAEAYGWTNTGQLIGGALGAALAGWFLDVAGPPAAFGCGAVLSAVALGVAAAAHRATPDMRGRDAGPVPETAPVPVQPA
ncbi:MFS transporter [Amnibacterium sp. CER49]|nr:MFS transporter [Amnibacterium sp. CER49]MDH2444197.1 MFS transporter [Amnibacterium sp. CER49]